MHALHTVREYLDDAETILHFFNEIAHIVHLVGHFAGHLVH